MLSLSRRIGEEVVLILPGFDPLDPAGHVVVQLVGANQSWERVQLGFYAPANVQVFRREVLEKPDFRAVVKV